MDASGQKVVVTGLGIASALGNDVQTFWRNLNAGKIGYAELSTLRERQTPFRVGGRVMLPTDDRLDRATTLALYAASQAVDQARVGNDGAGGSTVGVVMGTTCGANDAIEMPGFEENWFSGELDACPRESFTHYDHGAIANAVSRRFNFAGPSYVVGTACSAGNHAVGEALHLIQSGQADIVLCGGADAFTLLPVFGFYSMKSLAQEKCVPFDSKREGMILGEGAAVLVLERAEAARARGVTALAEVRGWALNCDAKNFAAPLETGERCEQLIRACVAHAGLALDDIDYINLHGTGTATNDAMEARGVARAYAQSGKRVAVSSIKGMLGHTLGAAGAIEALVATLAVQEERIPPNTPIAGMDEGVELNVVTQSTPMPVRHVMSLSFAFGGCNVATVFSRIAA